MSKNKLFAGVIYMIVVGCGCGVGYVLYNAQQQMNESAKVIARLEQEVLSANETADQAIAKAEDAKKKLTKADDKITDLQRENKKLEQAVIETIAQPKITETPTATPDPTVIATEVPDHAMIVGGDEFSDGYCYRHEHTGSFQTAPGATGDLTMMIQPADAGTTGMDTTNIYTIRIEDRSPGAHGQNLWGGIGSFAEDHCTLNITEMTHYISTGSGSLETVQTGETGVIRHDGDDKYWDDHSENITFGPFIRSS